MRLAKQDTLNIVTNTGEDLDPRADSELLFRALIEVLQEQEQTILEKAIIAIRTEAGQLF